MHFSARLFGAELLTMAQKADFPIVPKKGLGKAQAFFDSDQSNRTYPLRKAYLFDTYERMLSTDRLVLAFQNNNLRMPQIKKIRLALKEVKTPAGWEGEKPRIKMTMVRHGVLNAVVRKYPQLHPLTPLLSGPMFIISTPSLHPSLIPQILSLTDKATSFKPSPALPPPTPFTTTADLTSQPSSSSLSVNPQIFCVGGLVDDVVLTLPGLRTLGGMPGLKELQGQIVGMVGAPAGMITGVVGAGAGGQLSRLLEGLRVSLEEKEKPAAIEGGEEAKTE